MKTILIVDDEEEIRELLKKKLKQNKYEVVAASSGSDALDICRVAKPDLILLDIAMPQMDGYQTCEKLKLDESTKSVPILFLTGKDLDHQGITDRYKELQAIGFVTKPSPFKDLLEKVKEVIG